MNGDHFTPEEQVLIDRLRHAPQPRLSPRAAQVIRQKMLAEFAQPTMPPPQADGGTTWFTAGRFALGLAAAVTVIVVIGLLLTGDTEDEFDTLSPPTQIAAHSSATATPTATVATVTITPPPTEEPTPAAVIEATRTPSATTAATIIPSPTEEPTPTAVVEATDTPAPTATTSVAMLPSPTPLPSEEPVIVIEGPVQRIDDDTITVFDMEIAVAPDHPILNLIDVGDTLRIEGAVGTGNTLSATVIDNLSAEVTGEATVGLDGPVDSIEENIVIINGIDVAFDPDDPLLESLRVGDFLHVEGNFELREEQYRLVVVTVEIVSHVGGGLPPECYFEETGMGMGRWRCPPPPGMGMGAMGMGAMGMEAMGMGN
jgi:hypothetical protein